MQVILFVVQYIPIAQALTKPLRIFAAMLLIFLIASLACERHIPPAPTGQPDAPTVPNRQVAVADSFAFPVGKEETLTPAKDSNDEWYLALKFGEEDHLGDDWNKNSGGNTDCGEPVYAAANGEITFAADAGPGWGNVLIITHTLPDDTQVQTLYGHLQEMPKTSGEVQRRERIGKVGNANGRYLCHLHFELRDHNSRDWNRPGGGYSTDRTGWLSPSEFIDRQKHDR